MRRYVGAGGPPPFHPTIPHSNMSSFIPGISSSRMGARRPAACAPAPLRVDIVRHVFVMPRSNVAPILGRYELGNSALNPTENPI